MPSTYSPSPYSNGRLPESILVRLDSGTPTGRGRHVTTVASAVRYYGFRRDVQAETGVLLHISPGMNAYRDEAEQGIGRANACAQGNCAAAAAKGTSSHGGNMAYAFTGWQRVAAMAFDIGDYWRIPWATFKRIAERWGFEVGRITKAIAGIEEPWHIIDPRPHQPLAELEAAYGVTLTQGADGAWRLSDIAKAPEEEPEMILIKVKLLDGSTHDCGLGTGLFTHFMPADREDISRDMNRQPRVYDIGIGFLPNLLRKYGCDRDIWDVRQGKFVVLDPLTGDVAQGNTWSAARATRGAIRNIPLPTLDLSVLAAQVSDAVTKAIRENPVQVAVDETAIAGEVATAVLAQLPKGATPEQIAVATADVLAKRMQR